MVDDQIGGPTPARAIAAACLTIAQQLQDAPEKIGTYHFSGAPDASWCSQRLLIDRFDAANEPKSIGEMERAGGPDLWKGPRDLPEKAKQAGFQVIFLAKNAKDQSYLRLMSG